jgi:hypothetical protein
MRSLLCQSPPSQTRCAQLPPRRSGRGGGTLCLFFACCFCDCLNAFFQTRGSFEIFLSHKRCLWCTRIRTNAHTSMSSCACQPRPCRLICPLFQIFQRPLPQLGQFGFRVDSFKSIAYVCKFHGRNRPLAPCKLLTLSAPAQRLCSTTLPRHSTPTTFGRTSIASAPPTARPLQPLGKRTPTLCSRVLSPVRSLPSSFLLTLCLPGILPQQAEEACY